MEDRSTQVNTEQKTNACRDQQKRVKDCMPYYGTSWYNPSSETQGQSVGSGEKAGRKFSSTPVLENFHPAFSPDPTDYPWVSEDEYNPMCPVFVFSLGILTIEMKDLN